MLWTKCGLCANTWVNLRLLMIQLIALLQSGFVKQHPKPTKEDNIHTSGCSCLCAQHMELIQCDCCPSYSVKYRTHWQFDEFVIRSQPLIHMQHGGPNRQFIRISGFGQPRRLSFLQTIAAKTLADSANHAAFALSGISTPDYKFTNTPQAARLRWSTYIQFRFNPMS